MYQLKVGDFRFEYFVEGNIIYIVEGEEEVTGKVVSASFSYVVSTTDT